MKKYILFFLISFTLIHAQVTLKITGVPANTPANATIYLAGNFNGWNPSGTPMTADGNGNYLYTVPEGTGTPQFKFTRGSWTSVEGDANGQEIANRTFTFTGSPQTIELQVLSWKDLGAGNNSTAASNVHILNQAFFMPQLNKSRKIWIYLPPDYTTSAKNYPVLYMQDGQNLFDNSTAFSGEWQIDETLNTLFSQGDYGAIVIGIDNGGGSRIDEYSPWVNASYNEGGEGDAYMQFIAETLKPYVDANYRTRPEAKYNALIGSSLGALISTYGGVKYSGTFSKIGSFSPAYWFVQSELNNFITSSSADLSTLRIYHVAGSNESATMTANIQQIEAALRTKGLNATNSLIKMDAYGQHNESYWRGEFAAAYKWLFLNELLSVQNTDMKKVKITVEKNRIFVSGLGEKSQGEIIDSTGRLHETIHLNNGWNSFRSNLTRGVYYLKTKDQSLRFIAK